MAKRQIWIAGVGDHVKLSAWLKEACQAKILTKQILPEGRIHFKIKIGAKTIQRLRAEGFRVLGEGV